MVPSTKPFAFGWRYGNSQLGAYDLSSDIAGAVRRCGTALVTVGESGAFAQAASASGLQAGRGQAGPRQGVNWCRCGGPKA